MTFDISLRAGAALLVAALSLPTSAASLWPPTATPATITANDTNAVELGVKFAANVAGSITAIRYYKGPNNTGTHVGNLWSAGGTLLASATFANETASGWQQQALATPVAIAANTTYVVSYHAPNGNYSADNDYFATSGVTNAPLSAPAGPANGVYVYGATSAFPTDSFRASNYWVDVVFEPSGPPVDPPPAAAPILIVTAAANPFTRYYAEILEAEGLNAYAQADIAAIDATVLAGYDVVILGEMPLSTAQVTLFENYVAAGGNLVAMRPDKKLAPLLGLTDASATLADAYIGVDTSASPGAGIVGATMQFHATADRYALNGATAIATLYSNAATATANPAVTWRSVGANGGRAAAFVYDLAKSVVYTRQGNPAAAGTETDGSSPIRPDDLFFPNYVNLDKVAIPQADEQQRLLANLVTRMNLARKPLPRFWYLPNGIKAAIVHTLDDHNTAQGTVATFDKFLAASAPGCSVADWTCPRATSWMYTGAALTPTQALAYDAQGFELGVHTQNGCTDFASLAQLSDTYTTQLAQFATTWPGLPAQRTSRYHCIVWSDWASQAKAQLAHGIRYSMDYYYWPGSWVLGRPGVFTGSGLPMRFADLDGSVIDVYQGVSQLVNENDLAYPAATSTLLARALGSEGYYGLFGTHDDYRDTAFSDGVLSAAAAHGVPVISAQQALTWVDGRNASTFSAFAWNGTTLNFAIDADAGAHNLQAMLPSNSATHALSAITRGGVAVPFATQTIKGVSYAFFAAQDGNYAAVYDAPIPPPAAGGFTLWTPSTVPATPAFADTQAVELGVKFTSERRGRVIGVRFYKGSGNTGTHVGNLWNASGTLLASATFADETPTGWQQVNFATPVNVEANTTYVASYHAPDGHYAADGAYFATAGVDNPPLHAASGANGVFVYGASAFPTSTFNATNYWVEPVFVDVPPDTLWSDTTTPATASANDTSAVELGVKFTSDIAGRVLGLRFFKGVQNTGTHTGTLWAANGTALATATFANETASGWQSVLFATPVTIAANTMYVASYHAPNGYYAADANYFASAYDNAPLHAPSSAASGGNGVYRYGATTVFPDQTFNANNYWVDVIFERD
ncbi:DUF4082 domain-containing protein [Tahibacter soli]|uniref:DUF4082 domain-containing protein n=1 Tax=Tahibacter soli TaxID=2983605 RepID=A0A9X3YK54_9GAMM|nr:DUF4082 domain-containing protein [Tahibacter soli]MDC8013884.1 DUF4082 domain-containing protein [Tahibacter soli]